MFYHKCVDLYSGGRITVRTPNVLDALVTCKQVSYK